MITIEEDIKDGDIVYAWISPTQEKGKTNKKVNEHEYRFSRPTKGSIKLEHIEGGMWSVFPENMVESWYGNIRKV